ncbi:hypothetical protein [Oenococcus oeni]|uniref:hypothetical protein n=1 Tax=Oenococcus oeni TaxID=1247 RepID=UPI000ABF8DAE|nr:hypothetical protein [Oenococcus oeni]
MKRNKNIKRISWITGIIVIIIVAIFGIHYLSSKHQTAVEKSSTIIFQQRSDVSN